MHLKTWKKVENSFMDMKILEETIDLMTGHYLKTAGENFVNAKRAIFVGNDDDYIYNEGAFLDWLVCDRNIDYKKISNKSNEQLINAVKNSYFSIFEVLEIDNNIFVKDIFTGDDFKLENNEDLNYHMIFAGRIIELEIGRYYLKVFSEYDKELKKIFYSGLMKKYNEWFSEKGHIDIKEFINKESVILYKFLSIYDTISLNEEDEEYYVYQIEYIFADKGSVKELLEKEAEFIDECEDGRVYGLNIDEIYFVEVVLSENKLEVETSSEDLIEKCKDRIIKIFGDKVRHLKDLKLFIDDLL